MADLARDSRWLLRGVAAPFSLLHVSSFKVLNKWELVFVSVTAKEIYSQFRVGDSLCLELPDRTVSGILMPSHVFTSPGVVVLKVHGGYNIGIHENEVKEATLAPALAGGAITGGTASSPSRCGKPEAGGGEKKNRGEDELGRNKKSHTTRRAGKKPRVTIVTMGGTIASKVEYSTGAVKPVLDTDELLEVNPSLATIADITSVSVCNILSENMTPQYMADAARAIAKEIDAGVDGIVVTHGTDTMGYTAAMLGFMLLGLPLPVVFVGSQRSSDRPSSDAYENLYDAVLVASSGKAGVMVVMHGSSSDLFSSIHRGTKVRKFHTSKRDAFRSVNCEPLGRVYQGKVEWSSSAEEFFVLQGGVKERKEGYTPQPTWKENVSLFYIHPGLKKDTMASVLGGCEGVVLVGTGLGHLSEEYFSVLEEFIKRGGVAVMTSQCFNGTVNMNVYTNGRELLKLGVVPGGDMLPETALVKLMWVMGQTADRDEVIEMMGKNLRGELTERRLLEDDE